MGSQRAGVELVSLDEQRLLDAACRETGIPSFGDEGFREPLRLLLRALESEGRLTLLGRIAARADIAGLLTTRLRLEADRKRYPAIADEAIRRPLFVVGLPRTGSTLLHHLLAQDPGGRVARAWEVMEPSPPPERARYETDARIGRAARRLAWFDRIAPDFKRIHPLGAELPLECIAIMSASFASPRFHTTYHVPSYQAWLASADLSPAYDFHRRFLQHLQWRAPAGHWVLKAPSHVFGFEPLFATYPDAVVVQTHRDPLTVLASVASLTLVLQRAFTDHLDLAEIGAEVTERWSSGLERAMQARRDAASGRAVRRRALPGAAARPHGRRPPRLRPIRHDALGCGRRPNAALPRAPSQGQTRRSSVFPERVRARRAGPPPTLQELLRALRPGTRDRRTPARGRLGLSSHSAAHRHQLG